MSLNYIISHRPHYYLILRQKIAALSSTFKQFFKIKLSTLLPFPLSEFIIFSACSISWRNKAYKVQHSPCLTLNSEKVLWGISKKGSTTQCCSLLENGGRWQNGTMGGNNEVIAISYTRFRKTTLSSSVTFLWLLSFSKCFEKGSRSNYSREKLIPIWPTLGCDKCRPALLSSRQLKPWIS